MSFVSDILALLDRIGPLRRLREMPAKLEALEKRVAALEERPRHTCEICGEPMAVIALRPHLSLGFKGVRERRLRCASGHETSEIVPP